MPITESRAVRRNWLPARVSRIALGLLALLVLVLPATGGTLAAQAAPRDGGAERVEITVYWGDGCPHCAVQDEWLSDVVAAMPNVILDKREVWYNDANRDAFIADALRLGFEASGVPAVIVQERAWLGWSPSIGEDLLAAIVGASHGEAIHPGLFGTPGVELCHVAELTCSAEKSPDDDGVGEPGADGDTPRGGVHVDVPIFGDVDLANHSLFTSTVIIGFVDGINPCSLWVITVLLTIVVRTADRRRVLAVGATFLVVTTAMYALYMFGIYSALSFVSHIATVQYIAAGIAGVFGIVSVKDYFAFKKAISFSIADSAKPGLYQRMRRAATSSSLLPALGATIVLGVIVSLLETPCTAGFPVLWTGLLHAHGVTSAEAAGLFVAYMVPFLLDELIIFGIVVVTMRATRMHEKHGQLLKLYAGVMMLALCAVMLIDPGVMANPVLALVIFAGAFVAATIIHAVSTKLRARRSVTSSS